MKKKKCNQKKPFLWSSSPEVSFTLKKIIFFVGILFLLSSCNATEATAQIAPVTSTPEATIPPTIAPTNTPLPTPTATALPLVNEAVFPLQGLEFSDLRFILSNPYKFKYPFVEASGSDYNHTGIDLFFYKYKGYNTVLGHPILAVLPGKVVESLTERWPYGNMIMIETPLSRLSPAYLAGIPLPTPYSADEIAAHSNCIPDPARIAWSQTETSIYIVYAHMEFPSSFQAGDEVSAGDVIGAVGASGNAVEGGQHLHLEVRVGPSEAKFGVISDYMPDSTEEERYNYCIWALSEVFQPIDPVLLWQTQGDAGQ